MLVSLWRRSMPAELTAHRAGLDGLLIDLGSIGMVHAFAAAVHAHPDSAELDEVVPGSASVLLIGDRSVTDGIFADLKSMSLDSNDPGDGRTVQLHIRYDGPDLTEVARLVGLTENEVIELHTSTTHSVDFLGFSPGLAYISGCSDQISPPRRGTPRTRVSAGSVGIANGMTVIYPAQSAGGWSLIGTLQGDPMWNLHNDPPNRVQIGDQIRFFCSD